MTPISDGTRTALIGAGSALAGVVIGTVLMPWIRERTARARAARYLAIRVVCILNEFTDNCVSVALDSGGEGKDGQLEAQIAAPVLPSYPDDLDWRSVRHDLMYDLLSFSDAVRKAEAVVNWASNNTYAPDFSEFFETRSIQYANLGLRADTLAEQLRMDYRIPERAPTPYDMDWKPVDMLKRVVKETQERALARMNSLSVVTD